MLSEDERESTRDKSVSVKMSESGREKEKEGDRNTSGKKERRGSGRKLDIVEQESGRTEAVLKLMERA